MIRRSAFAFTTALALGACGGGEASETVGEDTATSVPVATTAATETTLGSNAAPAETTPPETIAEAEPDALASSSDGRPANWDPSEPYGYGDDEGFDALQDSCNSGDGDACDTLFWTSPAGSAYEAFGLAYSTFGDSDENSGDPLADALAMERPADWNGMPFTYGDDKGFDALWDSCAAGDSDACDTLFWTSPADSAYEAFGLGNLFE